MTYKKLFYFLEKIYDKNLAYEFDNTGLNIMANSLDVEVKNILICVDVIEEVIDIAVKNNVNLIISHHPITFKNFKNILDDSNSLKIKQLLNYGINCYSIHTNFDVKSEYGMADIVYNQFNFLDVKNKYPIEKINDKDGLGMFINFNNKISIEFLINCLVKNFGINEGHINYYSKNKLSDKFAKKIAILPGSGREYVNTIIEEKADIYISSDLSHHDLLYLYENNITYINATHYGFEKIFIYYMKQLLENYLNDNKTNNILIYENGDL